MARITGFQPENLGSSPRWGIFLEGSKQINNCICYECSGLNGNGKKSYRIYNSLFELKDHCVRKHEGILDKCVINYTLASKHIEIDIKKNGEKYIICDSDLLIEDKKEYDERKSK